MRFLREAQGTVSYRIMSPCYQCKSKMKLTKAYKHIHFAVMAIENAAKRMKIPSWEMYRRLKAQNLIHNRLLSHYEALHTQGIDWVAEDTVEALLNWESAK